MMTFSSCLEYGLVSFFHRQNVIQRSKFRAPTRKFHDSQKKLLTSLESSNYQKNISSVLTRRNKNISISNYELKPTLIPILVDKSEKQEKNEEITKITIDRYQDDFIKFDLKASRIDNCSRIIFPLIFFCFQLLYWSLYLTIYYTI
jgi:hypothetical protein